MNTILMERCDTANETSKLDNIRNVPTREYIKEDILILADFSKQNCLSAEEVIAQLRNRRYNWEKEIGDING